jgi:hypothetical protein
MVSKTAIVLECWPTITLENLFLGGGETETVRVGEDYVRKQQKNRRSSAEIGRLFLQSKSH